MAISTAVDLSAVARTMGVKTTYVNKGGAGVPFLPQRIAVVAQGNTASTYATTKAQVFSAYEVGATYGFGSPLHLAVLQLLPVNGDGVGTIPVTVYPLEDDGSGVAAAGDITPVIGSVTADANFQVKINEILSEAFTVTSTDTVGDIVDKMVIACAATPELPMTAADGTTKLDLTSKWKGASANDLYLEIEGPTDAGMTWTFTQPAGGATNPDVDTALNQVGDVWESLFLNSMEYTDTTTLGKFATFGEGRWQPLVRKYMMSFVGSNEATLATVTAVTDARKTDRTNVVINAPGSHDLPFVIAARALARIAKVANNTPMNDYAFQKVDGIVPGLDSEQWTYAQRDTAVKAGAGTTEVIDNVVNLSDTVTMYHPTGEQVPGYRYVADIVKLQQMVFNLDVIFNNMNWAGKALVPDDQILTTREARKPKMAVAEVAALVDALAGQAILSDPEAIKATIQAGINESNPKRLDLAVTIKLSGTTNIISIDNNFGFYFGTPAAVAE